ncbi:MAG: aldose 1-epimerase [Chitinophagaceae bacterium]
MSFAVSSQQTNGFNEIILEDRIACTQVVIHPENGALLHAFSIQTDNGPFNVIDNYPDPESLQNELTDSFKSCKLSPFACRIPAGRYTFNNRLYEFQKKLKDGSSIHGLLYDKPFTMADEFYDDKQAGVQLNYNYNKNDEGYPFEYRCEIRYTLMENNLMQVQTTIVNLSAETIPLADGWHPYFTLGGTIDEWTLQFNSCSMLEFNENLIPTGKLLPYAKFIEEQSLRGVDLDNSFLLNEGGNDRACILYNPSNKLSVSFFPDASYPYLQIYTPPDRQSIAIENLSGAPDCFNNKMGLIQLPPRQSKTFTVHYKTNKE